MVTLRDHWVFQEPINVCQWSGTHDVQGGVVVGSYCVSVSV